jgi:TolA-binding protein
MKLYFYSSQLLTFVDAKWTLAKFAAGGILLGTLLLLGVVKLNQSVADTLGSHSANALTAENDILRQQLNLVSPHVTKLETQAEELKERANELHKLLQRRKILRGTVMSLTNATEVSKRRSLMAAAKSPRP